MYIYSSSAVYLAENSSCDTQYISPFVKRKAFHSMCDHKGLLKIGYGINLTSKLQAEISILFLMVMRIKRAIPFPPSLYTCSLMNNTQILCLFSKYCVYSQNVKENTIQQRGN